VNPVTYLIWTTIAIAHLVGMAIAHGAARRHTLKPDLMFYGIWELWVVMWLATQAGTILWDALRWAATALDDIGYRIGR
jgi:hypothetical protein